jgi:hypothetical protein
MTDDRLWLRFDDRPFAAGELIRPPGFVPTQSQDPGRRGQLSIHRLHIVRAANPDRLPQTNWNDPERWCYQVTPQPPLERDPDRTQLDAFDSWICQAATVVRILLTPQTLAWAT